MARPAGRLFHRTTGEILMPNERSPVQHAVFLRRIDPELRMARFYSLMVERDLFGTITLVRAWGRIGTRGDALVQVFETEAEAEAALAALARRKRRRGCRDL